MSHIFSYRSLQFLCPYIVYVKDLSFAMGTWEELFLALDLLVHEHETAYLFALVIICVGRRIVVWLSCHSMYTRNQKGQEKLASSFQLTDFAPCVLYPGNQFDLQEYEILLYQIQWIAKIMDVTSTSSATFWELTLYWTVCYCSALYTSCSTASTVISANMYSRPGDGTVGSNA